MRGQLSYKKRQRREVVGNAARRAAGLSYDHRVVGRGNDWILLWKVDHSQRARSLTKGVVASHRYAQSVKEVQRFVTRWRLPWPPGLPPVSPAWSAYRKLPSDLAREIEREVQEQEAEGGEET